MMQQDWSTRELEHKRARAVRTAWVLGFIALVIFASFVGSAVLGR